MTAKSCDVVIVGGGIVGAACAAECAAEKLRVIVVEERMIGGGATAAGMGHLVVMDDSDAQFALTSYSQSIWNAMVDELPAEVEFDSCGTIWVAADDDEMKEVERKQRFYESRGIEVEVLDSQSLREAETNLREGLAGGLRVRADSVIYPPCAAQFFIDKARQKGGDLILGQKVVELRTSGVRLSNGDSVSASVIVNAAGSWSPTLTPGLPIQKRKGHLVITDRYPGFVNHQLVELGYLKSAHSLVTDSVAFNVQPRRTGQILIGSSRQYGIDEGKVDHGILRQMLERAITYLPGLGALSAIRSWTGFRAATPDKLPLIGRSMDQENLFLATGHEGLGITTSVGTAKLLVDQIAGREPKIPIEPYLPGRLELKDVHA